MSGFNQGIAAGVAAALLLLFGACSSEQPSAPAPQKIYNKPNNPDEIRKLLASDAASAPQEGIAAAILLDTSGSMSDPIGAEGKKSVPKIQVAQKALLNVLRQFSDFSLKHPDKKVLVGIYDFSVRRGQPSCRQVVRLGPPDVKSAEAAINGMIPSGGTPIGDAMITAKKDLDATGLNRRHILVISDGENNLGYQPGDVAKVITQEPEAQRAAIYFIAFDVGAELFAPVRDAGGLVLAAESERQLSDTLDFILTGKILVEAPIPPPAATHPDFRKK
jgi:Ca-activated chloride channel homolog